MAEARSLHYARFRLRLAVAPWPAGGAPRNSLPETLSGFLLDREILRRPGEVGVFLLDSRNRPTGHLVFRAKDRSQEVRRAFAAALIGRASALVLFSRSRVEPEAPNRADLARSWHVALAGNLLGIPLRDLLVVGERRWLSVADFGGFWQAAQQDPEGIAPFLAPLLTEPVRRPSKAGNEPLYQDPEDPDRTWTGRGPLPRWLRRRLAEGWSLDELLLGSESEPPSGS